HTRFSRDWSSDVCSSDLILLLFIFSLPIYGQSPQWIVFNTGNSGLPSNNISYIAVDHNNFVWIATPSGLVKFKNSVWSVYNTSRSEERRVGKYCIARVTQ